MRRVRDLINESGAGLWGTDKARERLQKDTPGQEIKSLVKKSQKVSEAMSDSEKRQALQKKIADVRRQYRAGTWDGNVNKDGKPVIHVDGKPMVVEGYDRAAISAALKKAAEKDNMKSKRDVERFFDYDGGDIIFRMVKDEDEANSLISQFKSQYKQKFKEDVDDNRDKLKMVNKNGNVVYATRDKVKHYMDLGYKSAAYVDARKKTDARTNIPMTKAYKDVQRIAKDLKNKKPGDTPSRYEAVDDSQKEAIRKKIAALDAHQDSLDKQAQAKQEEKRRIRQQNVDNNTKAIAIKNIDRILDRLDDVHRRVQTEKELLRDKLSESVQLNELKVSFKFDKLADAAKAERKAMQMKKLDVDSEKIQGKNMWLLHVTGSYTDIMKYLKRHDLEDKVHESAVIDEGMLDTLKQRVQQAQDALKKFRDSETAKKIRDDHSARVEKGKKILDAPNLRKKFNRESIEEGSESWEDGYKRRVVRTTKPEHKEKGYNWRIKGKDKDHLTIKLYKDKPSQEEFNKQMKRVAGHEFGG